MSSFSVRFFNFKTFLNLWKLHTVSLRIEKCREKVYIFFEIFDFYLDNVLLRYRLLVRDNL